MIDRTELDLLRLYHLFSVVRQFVLVAGGDGDGYVISPRWRELAEKFEQYETMGENWFSEKNVTEKVIAFPHHQEVICFVKSRDELPPWPVDIVVELP